MNRIRSILALAAIAVGALLPAAPAAAVDSDNFSTLVIELEHRRDDDLAEPADSTEKKQLKAVVKSLAAIGKANTEVKYVSAAGKVAGFLTKAFPNEFITMVHDASLGSLVSDLFEGITEDGFGAASSLGGRISSLPEKTRPKVQKQVDIAINALESVSGNDYKANAKALLKAFKAIAKGTKIADKASGGGGGGAQISMLIDGASWTAGQYSQSEIRASDDGMQVYGTSTPDGSGFQTTLYILVTGVTGPGSYSLDSSNDANLQVYQSPNPPTIFTRLSGGTFNVTHFDPPNRVAGTFQFSASDGSTTKVVTNGTFDITENIYMQP